MARRKAPAALNKWGFKPGRTIKGELSSNVDYVDMRYQYPRTREKGCRESVVSYSFFGAMGSWLARDACSVVCGFTPTVHEEDLLFAEAQLWELAQGAIRAGTLAIFGVPEAQAPEQWNVAPKDFIRWADGKILSMDGAPQGIPPMLLACLEAWERESAKARRGHTGKDPDAVLPKRQAFSKAEAMQVLAEMLGCDIETARQRIKRPNVGSLFQGAKWPIARARLVECLKAETPPRKRRPNADDVDDDLKVGGI